MAREQLSGGAGSARRKVHLAAIAAIAAVATAAPSAAQAAAFTPVADSYVDASAPSSNKGRSTTLKTDGSPIRVTYIRFNVQGVGSISSARLRIFAASASSSGFQVHLVNDNTWSETGITYNNAPSYGPVIASSGSFSAGTWSQLNVSSVVTGDGPVTLALTSASSTSISYSSNEGSNPPQLIAPAPAPSTSFTVTRSGSTYQAQSPQGTTYSGALKSVVESTIHELRSEGGGAINFSSGTFDLGDSWFKLDDVSNITFQGQGIDSTVIQNSSSRAADTEPFNTSTTHNVVIRDMTVFAGGPFRSTSDAIDMDGGNNDLIERVKITGSRARGIIFDGKDIIAGQPRTADGNTIRDCVIAGVPSHGIEFLASRSNTVEGCTITNVAGNGIQITKASTVAGQANKKSSDNTLSGNSIDNSGKDGVNVTSSDRNQITGNTVLNSSDDTSGRDGIRITSSDSVTCDDNVVAGNTSGDNQAVHTQKYGLNIVSSLCHTTLVGANTFFGNLTAPIRDLGSGTQYQ